MKILLIFIFLFTFWNSFSQEKQFADKKFYLVDSLVLEDLSNSNVLIIDSCLKLYHQTNEDSLKWEYLNTIIENTYSKEWYEFQKIASKLVNEKLKQNLSNADKKTFLSFKAANLNNEGFREAEIGNLNNATNFYEQAVNLQRTINQDGKFAIQLSNLANNYYKTGKIQKAIELYEESVILSKKINDENTAYIISNLAMIYNNLERTDQAFKLLNEALEFDKSEEFSVQKAKIYTDLGTLSKNKFNDFEKALSYYNKSLVIHKKIRNRRGTADQYSYISDTQLRMANPDTLKALSNLKKSLNLNIKINDADGISSCYENFSKIYLKQNKRDSALTFGIKAYENAIKSNRPRNIQKSSNTLSRAYYSIRNYKKAFYYKNIYHKMLDSLNNKETTFALAKTEAKLQYEKEKELENIKHQAQIKLKEKEAEKQTLYKRFFIIGSIFLIIILSIIIRQLMKSNKQTKIIQKSNLILEEQHKEITSSITYAKRIQNAILPPLEHINKELSDSFVYYQPKDIVSGDFYWMEKTKNKLHFAVADCTGHGVPGAMVSVICNNGLNRSVREHQLDTPNEILDKTREIVIKEFEKSGEDIKDGMDISLVSIDFKNNLFEFSGAHNSAWVIRKADESFELIELKGDKQPIGNFERALPFTKKDFSIQKGDILFLSSDGYADQFGGEKNKKIKNTNFKKLLIQNAHLELKKQQSILKTFFEEWKGDNEQLDDVCVVGIKF